MTAREPSEIRTLAHSDLAPAMRLQERERWNQTADDWRRLLTLSPRGCFAACRDGQLAGTVTTVQYGAELAWIGMMLVDAAQRRCGVGTGLMRAALAYLEGAGVRTVKLDATPAGQPLYESLGFVVETRIERWQGAARASALESLSPVGDEMRSRLLALDRRAFGADRSTLLESLIANSCVAPVVVTPVSGAELRGYACARRGRNAAYVGPVVATDPDAAAQLLDGMLGNLADQEVYVDLHTSFAAGSQLLAQRGFVRQRDLARMRRGEEVAAGSPGLVFAIAGPELG